MKKLLVFAFICLLLSLSCVNVLASAQVGLDVSYSTLENGNILVYASVIDIKDPLGLCGIGYDIEYDSSVLKLEKVDSNIPDKWKPFVENGMVEDWSVQKSDGVYSWSLLNCEFGHGITEDNQLYAKIEFKPLEADVNTSIRFKCVNAINDNVVEIDGESKILNIGDGGELPIVSPEIKNSNSSTLLVVVVSLAIICGAIVVVVLLKKKGKNNGEIN